MQHLHDDPRAAQGEWHALLPRYLWAAPSLTDKRVLELGCGHGLGSVALCLRAGCDLTAVDTRPDAIEEAQRRFEELAHVFRAAPSYLALGLDAGEGGFDAILALREDLPWDEPGFLSSLRGLLAPGGVLVCALRAAPWGLADLLPGAARASGGAALEEALREHYPARMKVVQRHDLSSFLLPLDPEGAAPAWDSPAASNDDALVAEQPLGAEQVLWVCAQEDAALEPWRRALRVALSADKLAQQLGQLWGQSAQSAEDASQRALVLEEQLEDRARLVDDLEEELRAQRALSADQADRLAHLQPPSAPPLAPAPHDAVLVAQLRADLADSQRALLDLSAEFHQSSQGMLWAIQERDQHILQLRTSLHAWEQHGQRLEGELGARDLLLENLHQVLARQAAELDALRARPAGGSAGGVEATEDKGLVRALRQEVAQALDAAKQERAYAARAAAERERIREVMLQAREELAQRTLALGRAQQTLDAQEKQAVAFAEEVAGVYDERNRLKAALEKAQEELDKLNKVSKEAMDLSLNVDRELARRKDQLAALQREQVDLNIEKVNLEREVGQLLKRKNDADRRIAALEAELAQAQAELAQARAGLTQAQAELAQAQADLQAQDTRHQGELQGAQVLLAEREDALKRALRAMTAHERELGAKERELRAHQQRLAEQAEALGHLQAALDALQPAPAPTAPEAPAAVEVAHAPVSEAPAEVAEAPAPAVEAPAPAVEEKPKRARAPKKKVEPVAAVEVVAEAPAPPPEDPAPAPPKPKRAPAKPKQPR